MNTYNRCVQARILRVIKNYFSVRKKNEIFQFHLYFNLKIDIVIHAFSVTHCNYACTRTQNNNFSVIPKRKYISDSHKNSTSLFLLNYSPNGRNHIKLSDNSRPRITICEASSLIKNTLPVITVAGKLFGSVIKKKKIRLKFTDNNNISDFFHGT